eukprot:68606-Pleurochrysis_carterae.AAC.2
MQAGTQASSSSTMAHTNASTHAREGTFTRKQLHAQGAALAQMHADARRTCACLEQSTRWMWRRRTSRAAVRRRVQAPASCVSEHRPELPLDGVALPLVRQRVDLRQVEDERVGHLRDRGGQVTREARTGEGGGARIGRKSMGATGREQERG